MKRVLLLLYLLLMLELFLQGAEAPGATALPRPEQTPAARPTAVCSPAPEEIVLLVEGQARTLPLQDYLRGVLAAEMPASFPEEALKAQAVAARSYALYCAAGAKHGDAQICADPGCCQAWQDEAKQREKWGADYEKYAKKIAAAVEATEGEYLHYEGQAVFAAFHSSSAGATEESGAIWNPLPYLVSVPSPETAADVPGYVSELSCAPLDFRDTILSACPQADFTGPEEQWIGEIRREESGRVEAVVLSDILGDPLDMIASGPAAPDSSTCDDALTIARECGLRLSEKAWECLQEETPKALSNVHTQVIGSVRQLCAAAAEECRRLGYETVLLTDQLCCEAREAGSFLASVVKTHAADGRKLAFIAGGMNVLYRAEKLPLMAAVFIHGTVLYISYLITYLLNDWLDFGALPIIVFSAVFVVGYIVIWAII